MEFIKGLKKYLPKFPTKGFVKQISLDAESKKKVIALFINTDFNYLVGVTETEIQVFDLKNGNRISAHNANSNIVSADFTYQSDYATILVVSFADQTITIFEPNELIKLRTFSVAENDSWVTTIDCQIGKSIVVGYSNGIAKLFNLKVTKEEQVFKGTHKQDSLDSNEECSSINHIKVSKAQKLVYLSHVEYFQTEQNQVKIYPKTPVLSFEYETGQLVNEYRIPNLSVKAMALVEEQNALLLLSAGHHKLYVINTLKENVFLQISTTFENITDECMISHMAVTALSKELIEAKNPLTEFTADAMIIFSLDNGNVLTSLLNFEQAKEGEGFSNAQLLPQNLFTHKTLTEDNSQKAICALAYTPKCDLIVYGDMQSVAWTLPQSLNSIVQANSYGYSTVQYEDPKKLPIFSLRPFKKKDDHKEELKKEKQTLPLFSISPNLSEVSAYIDSYAKTTAKDYPDEEAKGEGAFTNSPPIKTEQPRVENINRQYKLDLEDFDPPSQSNQVDSEEEKKGGFEPLDKDEDITVKL